MSNLFLLAVVLCVPAAILGQNFNGGSIQWYCDILSHENCNEHGTHDYRCGTNKVTYNNMCYFGKAHCMDNTINQLHVGPCRGGSTTTLSPQQIVHGSEVILDVQCAFLSHKNCTYTINEKICATNGVTYPDFCEYEKNRCTHRDLHVAKLGDCSA